MHRYLTIGTQEEPADDTGDAKMIAADDQAEDNDDKPLKGRLAGEARAQVVQDRRDAGNHDDGLLCLRTCHHPGANWSERPTSCYRWRMCHTEREKPIENF